MGLYIDGSKIILPRKSDNNRIQKKLVHELRRLDIDTVKNNPSLLDDFFDLLVVLDDVNLHPYLPDVNIIEELSCSAYHLSLGFEFNNNNNKVSEKDLDKIRRYLFSVLGNKYYVKYDDCIYIYYNAPLILSYVSSLLAMKQIVKNEPEYFKIFKEWIILSLAYSFIDYDNKNIELNELIGIFVESYLDIEFGDEIPMLVDSSFKENIVMLRRENNLNFDSFSKMVVEYFYGLNFRIGKKNSRYL